MYMYYEGKEDKERGQSHDTHNTFMYTPCIHVHNVIISLPLIAHLVHRQTFHFE